MALIATASLVAGIALARSAVTPFTLTETMGPNIEPGQWTFLPSGNILVRGRVSEFNETASDARLSGTLRATTNANLDSNWTGPMWGTSHSVVGDGVWDGTWNGNFNFITGSGDYDAVGHGSGAFDGLQVMEHCVYVHGVATCTGRILETKAQ